MARTPGRRSNRHEEVVALARGIFSEIQEYNRRFPNAPFPIDDATSRIIANDPAYVPRRTRKGVRPPTENPGVFTVKRIADALGTTVGAFLRESGFEITTSDIRTFRWIDHFLRMRFPIESTGGSGLPAEHAFKPKEFSFPKPLVTTLVPQKGEVAAGSSGRDSDFEVVEREIVGTQRSTSLFTAVVSGRSMADRIRDGDTIVIDTSKTPRQGDPVAVNVEHEGGILGYWRAEAGKYFLDKHNTSEFKPVTLPHASEWQVIGVLTLV